MLLTLPLFTSFAMNETDLLFALPLFASFAMTEAALLVQHPGSISQTEVGDVETDGVDSDDDNDMLQKSDQVRRLYINHLLHASRAVPPA